MTSVSKTVLRPVPDLGPYYTQTEQNAAFDVLEANIQRISDQLDATRIGQSLYLYDAPIDSLSKVSQPVYWNAANGRFEQSKIELQTINDRVFATDSSEAWALVIKRCSADRADLLISGVATLDLTESAGSPAPTGKFYLTDQKGILSATPLNSVLVPVLVATGQGDIIFRPWFADTFPRYVPKLLELSPAAAGNAIVQSGKAVINNPNPSAQGWLPANHSAFGGNQPSGAKFGYNIAADADLDSAWPPLDPASCRIYYEAGGTESVGAQVLLGNDNNRLLINDDGIWWMTDCDDQAPWDIPKDGGTTGTCPKPYARKMTLEADFGIHGEEQAGAVSSLGSQVPWLKSYKKGTTTPATAGPLELGIDVTELFDNDESILGLALKGIEDGKFLRGPVVAGLKAENASINISGGLLFQGYRYGRVSLSVSASKDLDLLPMETKLDQATTEHYGETIALGLPPGINSNFVSTFHIPGAVPAASQVRFQFWILAQTLINLPTGMTTQFRRFQAPPDGETQMDIPSFGSVAFNYTPGMQVSPGKYVRALTDSIEVSGGDTLYLQVGRAGATDGVSADVHILKHYGQFVIGE